MRLKILFIGGSHLGALIAAYRRKPEYYPFEIDFLACPAFNKKDYKYENKLIEAISKRSIDFLKLNNTSLKKYPESFDLVVILSHIFRTSHLAKYSLRRKYLYNPNPQKLMLHYELYDPITENAFKASVRGQIKASWEYQLSKQLSETVSTPLILMRGPNHVEMTKECPDYPADLRQLNRQRNKDQIEKLVSKTGLEIYQEIPNLTIISQHKRTIVNELFTKHRFMNDAHHILFSSRGKPQRDFTHANKKYGRLQLKQIIEHLEARNLVPQEVH